MPDSITIEEFFSNEEYGRTPFSQSRNPYTCGITGKTYTVAEVAKRTDHLSRAIAQILHFDPNEGTEWDRVVGLYSLNTVSEAPIVSMLLAKAMLTRGRRSTTFRSATPSTASQASSPQPVPHTLLPNSNTSCAHPVQRLSSHACRC